MLTSFFGNFLNRRKFLGLISGFYISGCVSNEEPAVKHFIKQVIPASKQSYTEKEENSGPYVSRYAIDSGYTSSKFPKKSSAKDLENSVLELKLKDAVDDMAKMALKEMKIDDGSALRLCMKDYDLGRCDIYLKFPQLLLAGKVKKAELIMSVHSGAVSSYGKMTTKIEMLSSYALWDSQGLCVQSAPATCCEWDENYIGWFAHDTIPEYNEIGWDLMKVCAKYNGNNVIQEWINHKEIYKNPGLKVSLEEDANNRFQHRVFFSHRSEFGPKLKIWF